jgi:hypothetical protein
MECRHSIYHREQQTQITTTTTEATCIDTEHGSLLAAAMTAATAAQDVLIGAAAVVMATREEAQYVLPTDVNASAVIKERTLTSSIGNANFVEQISHTEIEFEEVTAETKCFTQHIK